MSWIIWNLSLKWSPTNMLLFIGVIIWNVVTRATPNQNLNLLSQRYPSEVFFLIQIKRVHTMKWSSNCSQYMFPRSSEFFEFACIKLIPRCILQINCEEYKHRDCCPKRRWKVVVLGHFLSCISYNDSLCPWKIYFSTKFTVASHLPFSENETNDLNAPPLLPMLACRNLTCLFFGMYDQIVAMLVSLHPCPVQRERRAPYNLWERNWLHTHQHCCLIFSWVSGNFSLVRSLECVCNVCSYWMISKQKFCFYTNSWTVKSCLLLNSQCVCACMGKLAFPNIKIVSIKVLIHTQA